MGDGGQAQESAQLERVGVVSSEGGLRTERRRGIGGRGGKMLPLAFTFARGGGLGKVLFGCEKETNKDTHTSDIY